MRIVSIKVHIFDRTPRAAINSNHLGHPTGQLTRWPSERIVKSLILLQIASLWRT
jgi:hypothetical protein